MAGIAALRYPWRAVRRGRRKEGIRVADIKIDVCCQTCPQPLVEFRKAVRLASPGDVLEIIGTHPTSKQEIPLAVKALNLELLSVEQEGDTWKIRVRR